MRPHRLRVTAFGAFAATEEVVFDDLEGLFLLHGETGAGKTTLLDAIAFALYGRVPGVRGGARRLRSDHAAPRTATEVELEATIGGRRLRVTRRPEQARPKKSGTGVTTEPSSVRLAELAADGTWESKSTRIGEVDAEVEQLMGMSAAQFFQVVLLPQGEFAKFLRADAKDKQALLQRLFGTDRFRRVEDWLAERRRATDKEVAAAEDSVSQLAARIAQAAGCPVPEAAGADPTGLGQWAVGLAAASVAERDASASAVDAHRAQLDAALEALRAAERLADRQRRRRAALDRKAALETAEPQVAVHRGHAAALHAAARQEQARAGRLEALRTIAQQADTEDAAAASARARAAALAADLDRVQSQALHRQAARPAAEQDRNDAAAAAAALPAARERASAARQVAADSAALAAEHARRVAVYEAHLTAREKAVAAQDEAVRVRGARVDGMRAELAAAMTDGTPCPVCGSLDHPDPVSAAAFPPVGKDAEEAAFALASEAARAADEAGQRVAAIDAVLADLTRRLTAVGFTVAGPAKGAVFPDAGVLAEAARAAERDAAHEEAQAGRLGEAAARLPRLQGDLDELDADIAADRAALTELAGQRAAAVADADAARARAADRRAELAAALDGAADLEGAIGAATALADALRQAAAAADQLADPDLEVALDPSAPVTEAAQLADAAQHAHAAAASSHGQAAARAEQLASLLPRLEGALGALRPLRERAEQARRLADLANGTGNANQYKMTLSSFVLAARLEEVAAAASERLLTMTAGRYSLVHSDARKGNAKAGLSLLACDAWTGIDRDTATLSGGETFLASLALALGLADVVTAESAGTPMEALFIDEGFGTLDEDTLDEVMNVLDGLRAGGRVVGIVSHVSELRQRIPAQVRVRKGRAGSRVEVVAG